MKSTELRLTSYILFVVLTFAVSCSSAFADNIDLMDQRYNTHIDQDELDKINSKFPEYGGLDQSLLNPTQGLNLTFNQKATLTFTFINEGAGYRNSVGYFLFDHNNNILSEHTIFSNASKKGSGGLLQAGDTVVLGSFDKGTHLGFWLQADGYTNPNGTKYYSLWDKNADGKNHFALWVNKDSQNSVFGIEDIPNLGDKDYNDILFTVKTDPFNATNHGGDINATPEPGTILLLGSSLLGLYGWRRRRCTKNA